MGTVIPTPWFQDRIGRLRSRQEGYRQLVSADGVVFKVVFDGMVLGWHAQDVFVDGQVE